MHSAALLNECNIREPDDDDDKKVKKGAICFIGAYKTSLVISYD